MKWAPQQTLEQVALVKETMMERIHEIYKKQTFIKRKKTRNEALNIIAKMECKIGKLAAERKGWRDHIGAHTTFDASALVLKTSSPPPPPHFDPPEGGVKGGCWQEAAGILR